jgi:solute carrier family 10 (sodium/bile acid cotransporter), member 7
VSGSLKRWLSTYWFAILLLALPAVVALDSSIGAKNGPLEPEWSVHAAVALAFLISGITLQTRQLSSALGNVGLHSYVQSYSFVLFPLIAATLLPLSSLSPTVDALVRGTLILACLPTTIAGAPMCTRLAGGNEAAALCNAVFGNLIGIAVTPFLLFLLFGRSADVAIGTVIWQLARDVGLPILAGQLIQRVVPGFAQRSTRWLRVIPNICILFIVYTVLCSHWSDLAESSTLIIPAIVGVVVLHVLMLALCWRLSGALRFERADRIAALFASTQKTIALGMPVVELLFGNQPNAGLLALPLMLYHPTQLVIDGVLASRLRSVDGLVNESKRVGEVDA